MRTSTNHGKRRRILLVDDHPLVRGALKETIERERDLSVCGEAEDRECALAAIEAQRPDMAIVDLSLKNSDGLDLVKDITQRHPKVLTLVLSMHDETLHAERAIRAGASGYISKQEAASKVMDAVRKILGGQTYWSHNAIARTLEKMANGSLAEADSASERLSERELQVFELIGVGSSVAEIAWTMGVGVSTVDTYRARIKEKLNFKDASELRREAIRWTASKKSR